ncbi:MAG: efflux RND transporter periplasmic adaptor subunit [Rhizomicrobium sp.]
MHDIAGLSPKSLRRVKLAGLVALCVAVLVVGSGIATRLNASKRAVAFANEQAIQTVTVVRPTYSTASGTLKLPGKLEAYYSAPIYARVSGYVHAWYTDIGAHVRKGQVLALIDTPELNQQLDQAKADLADAFAAQTLSQTTARRWTSLLALDAVSKQEAEEKTGDLAAKVALVTAAKANVDRMSDLKEFAHITAPFDGTITKRNIDIGMLVNAGVQSSTQALFTVSDMHKIRVYVSVPQSYSNDIGPGLTASMSVPEYPGRVFQANLDSTSDAISEQSNTLLVEFLADNASGALKPGEYAQVTIRLPASRNIERLPASALIFRAHGLQVATVQPDERIRLKSISIARDLGTQIEVNGGLNSRDEVVDNPPDSIETGDRVRIVAADGS